MNGVGTRVRFRSWLPVVLVAAAIVVIASARSAIAASVYWVDVCGGSTGGQAQGLDYWASDGNIVSSDGCGSVGGGISIDVAGASGNEGAGGQGNWTVSAPAGESITGMAVSSAQFTSSNGWQSGWQGATGGGLSVSDDPWPWQDCNSSGAGYCSNGSGPAVAATAAPLSEVGIDVYCGRSSCPLSGDGLALVNGWSVLVSDPSPAASIALGADPSGNALAGDANGQWISGAIHNTDTVTVTATDPGGVCALSVYMWTGALTIFDSESAGGSAPFSPADADPALGQGGQNGQFTAMSCGATTRTLTFAPNWSSSGDALSALASGCYHINAVAQNPSQLANGQVSTVLNNAPICVDNATPTASISSSANESSWYSTPQQITVDASEPYAGVQDVVCTGGGIGTQTFTNLPATFTVSQVGRDTVTCTPTSNVGTPGNAVTYTVGIDTQTPSVSFSGAQGAPAWLTGTPTVDAGGSEAIQASGISQIACTGVDQTTGAHLSGGNGGGASTSLQLGPDGEYRVTCTATTGAGITGSASENLQLDNQTPSVAFSGAAAAPAWNGGTPSITATGSEAVPLSGVAATTCSVDGRPATTGAGAGGDTVQVSGDGEHLVTCSAVSGAGVQGPASTETVQVDDSTPTLSYSNGPSQTAWYRTPQQITITAADPGGGSGIGEIDCTVGSGTSTTYSNPGDTGTQTQTITVDPPGGDLVCNAENGAGSWAGTKAWTFQLDDQPPTGYFLPPDPNDPTVVAVQVADDQSGIASVTIELDGTPLPTTLNPTNGIAAATVPDNGSIPDGTHTLAAVVTDVAGNTATITRAVDLEPASITLPLRLVTELTAVLTAAGHQRVAATAQIASAAERAACRLTRIVLRRANAAEHTATSSRLKRTCRRTERAAHKPPAGRRWLSLRFHQTGQVHGELLTADGDPVANAQIEIVNSVAVGAGSSRQVATATTDGRGDWSWKIPPGPTRAFTFLYQGTAVMRTSSATASVRVAGHQVLQVPEHLVAGMTMLIRGRVQGGWVPPGGVLVQLWYRVRGQLGGWSPFANVIHTDRRGRWHITIPITPRSKGYTYEFRAVSVQQTGWPYLGATSHTVTRTIR